MRKQIYIASVVLTAIALFWPILYGNITILMRIPGDPVLQAVAGVLVFGTLAYFTYGEDEGAEGEEAEEEFTASG
ncbi:hypothetical protein [Thermococcus pacificus]|uniref:Uncharacterized protein n=1 Tax=Thermococcus pacificus TaxID=71998 RepID=A0A218P529_9EURY|nr:hypothetical protein [Thermococcus pacificus]ASJ05888.1 hypothetical protein A3L08_00325 [Thermococcus pacificus]